MLSVPASLLLAALVVAVPPGDHAAFDSPNPVQQAAAWAERGRYAEAIALLSGVVERDPELHPAFFLLGSLYADVDPPDHERALSYLVRAVELSPEATDYRRMLGTVQMAADRLPEAIATFEEVLEQAPNDTVALLTLVYLYQQEPFSQLDRAVECGERARRLAPWNVVNYVNLGLAYEKRGDFEKAERYYRLLQRNFPHHPHAEWVAEHLRKVSGSTYRLIHAVETSNRGPGIARDVELWVMIGRDFPPHTTVKLTDCDPPWECVVRDSIGQRVAGFRFEEIGPGEKRTVQVGYEVRVCPVSFDARPSTPAAYVTDSEYAYYTAPERFIEADVQLIQQTALEVVGGATDRLWAAHRLYDFVIDTLDYAVQNETYGALAALKTPGRADCTEFAALFVALARAAGIPSRIVFGFIYDSDRPTSEQAHTWAEFLLPDRRWIPADPTFGQRFSEEYFARVSAHHLAVWVPSRLLEGAWSHRLFYSVRGREDASLETREYTRIFPVGTAAGDSTASWMAEELAGSATVAVLPALSNKRPPLGYLVGIAALFLLWVVWRRLNGSPERPAD